MDLREKKTKRNIKDAFLQLRAHKPLERITVKELSEIAEISKATFYLHYKDIYDLSEQLQDEIIQKILENISHPDLFLSDTSQFTHELFHAFCSYQSLTEILFSDGQSSILPLRIEQGIKEFIIKTFPNIKHNAQFNIQLSYQIYGAYFAYHENHKSFGSENVLETLSEINSKLALETD